jgi:hypothetical protein
MAHDRAAEVEVIGSAPAPELACLEPLLGKWRTHAHTEDTDAAGAGVPVTSVEEFHWLEGGHFLVQTYETVFGSEPMQKGINYWYFDAKSERFHIIFFSNNGSFSEEGNRYQGEIASGTLALEGPARFAYELDSNGRIRTNPDGTITIKWWLRDAHGRFQPWMTNVFRRV